MQITFKVDVSKEIGLGHLMRCLALFQELKKRRHRCLFVSKITDNRVIEKIKGFQVDFYKLKSNLQDELKELIEFSKDHCVDWLIMDSYRINSDYIKNLKKENLKVLSIDDTAQIHYHSDVVLNQNIGAEKLEFSAEKYTKFLLGPKYIMIRDDLLKRDKKIENDKVKKILVTLGGSDNDNLTLKILRLLGPINENIEVLVVVGPFNPFYDDIEGYIRETGLKIKLIKSPENMAKVYLESDIAVSAGGSSCYELAYFGIPNIIITVADNQIHIAKELDKKKISINLGKKNELKAEQFKDKIDELIFDHRLRKMMSQHGKKLVDGKGKERIIDFMERFN